VAGCNGLSTPAIVDVEMDRIVDYAFAGDLKGNMWKFDLRGADKANWTFSYMAGTTPKPLISVKNSVGDAQPITAAPEVMLDCVNMTQGRGLMVIFGTGRYVNKDDFDDTTVQALYGIWDWAPMWEAKDSFAVAQTKYLGNLNTDRSLSNMVSGIGLIEQVFEYQTAGWLVLSDNPIDWYNPVDNTGTHMGWVVDLAQSGERSIQEPTLREGVVIFVSTIPSNSPCVAGGSSVVYKFRACSGGRTAAPQFDIGGDEHIDDSDKITTTGGPLPPSGQFFSSALFGPLPIGPWLYFNDPEGQLPKIPDLPVRAGMFYWRVLGQ